MARSRILLALLLALGATQASAHHSLSSYDPDRTVEISGTLRDTKIANPHTWFWVLVPSADQGEPVEWGIETAGVAFVLRSLGAPLRNQFAPGQKVTVSFHPARDGGRTGLLVRLHYDGGKTLDGVPVK